MQPQKVLFISSLLVQYVSTLLFRQTSSQSTLSCTGTCSTHALTYAKWIRLWTVVYSVAGPNHFNGTSKPPTTLLLRFHVHSGASSLLNPLYSHTVYTGKDSAGRCFHIRHIDDKDGWLQKWSQNIQVTSATTLRWWGNFWANIEVPQLNLANGFSLHQVTISNENWSVVNPKRKKSLLSLWFDRYLGGASDGDMLALCFGRSCVDHLIIKSVVRLDL